MIYALKVYLCNQQTFPPFFSFLGGLCQLLAVVKRVVCFSQRSLKNMTFWLALLIYFSNFSLLCVLFEIPAAAVLRSQLRLRPRFSAADRGTVKT